MKKSNFREFDDICEGMLHRPLTTAAALHHWLDAHWQISQWQVAQSRQLIGMLQPPVISITIDATAELPVRMLTISGILDAEAKALAA